MPAPSAALRDALQAAGRASVARMTAHEDALVFWYDEDDDNARATARHYSGLTQGYYTVYLARGAQVLRDDALRTAADRVFASLLVPVERGGVLHEGREGPSIAELPKRRAASCSTDGSRPSRRPRSTPRSAGRRGLPSWWRRAPARCCACCRGSTCPRWRTARTRSPGSRARAPSSAGPTLPPSRCATSPSGSRARAGCRSTASGAAGGTTTSWRRTSRCRRTAGDRRAT